MLIHQNKAAAPARQTGGQDNAPRGAELRPRTPGGARGQLESNQSSRFMGVKRALQPKGVPPGIRAGGSRSNAEVSCPKRQGFGRTFSCCSIQLSYGHAVAGAPRGIRTRNLQIHVVQPGIRPGHETPASIHQSREPEATRGDRTRAFASSATGRRACDRRQGGIRTRKTRISICSPGLHSLRVSGSVRRSNRRVEKRITSTTCQRTLYRISARTHTAKARSWPDTLGL